MAKMRMFKFWNEAGDEKEKESMSLKKHFQSMLVQNTLWHVRMAQLHCI